MKCGVIDIGSNSMRLTVYDAEKNTFRILFKEKIMTALASYVEYGALSEEGIESACSGLMEFRERLEVLEIRDIYVFATASLRNITNTEDALNQIYAKTGFAVEVISGYEEAMYGFSGAMCDVAATDGIFTDIGGASTEISIFCEGRIRSAESFPIGSLKLYRECVRNIVPGKGSMKRIGAQIEAQFKDRKFACEAASDVQMVCIGGTARAVLKLAAKVFSLPAGQNHISRKQLDRLCEILFKADKAACDLILKTAPERIHTLIPGMMILQYIAERFGVSRMIVSRYSVREGYLCQKIQTEM